MPGKFLYTVDALSRALILSPGGTYLEEAAQTELFVQAVVSHLPADSDPLHQYRAVQKKDNTCVQLITFCKRGWPSKSQLKGDLWQYWSVRGELSLHEDLLLRGSRIVVPQSLQRETLQKIHNGHQGIQRCLSRVASSVRWSGISQQVPHYPHGLAEKNGQNYEELIGKIGGPIHGTLELQSDTSTMVRAQPCTTLNGKTTENRRPPNKDYPNTGLAISYRLLPERRKDKEETTGKL